MPYGTSDIRCISRSISYGQFQQLSQRHAFRERQVQISPTAFSIFTGFYIHDLRHLLCSCCVDDVDNYYVAANCKSPSWRSLLEHRCRIPRPVVEDCCCGMAHFVLEINAHELPRVSGFQHDLLL